MAKKKESGERNTYGFVTVFINRTSNRQRENTKLGFISLMLLPLK